MSRPRREECGWARARTVLEVALAACGVDLARQQIGRLHFVGKGLTYRVWMGVYHWPASRGEAVARVVVRLPGRDAAAGQPEFVEECEQPGSASQHTLNQLRSVLHRAQQAFRDAGPS